MAGSMWQSKTAYLIARKKKRERKLLEFQNPL
jgi:hypothetical protein